MHEKNFESLFIDILLHNNQKLTIGTLYRSPNQKSSANAQFIDTLSAILTPISLSKTAVMITGDLNTVCWTAKTLMLIISLI